MDYFLGPSQRIFFTTTVVERNKKVFLSSLKLNVIAVIDYLWSSFIRMSLLLPETPFKNSFIHFTVHNQKPLKKIH